MATRLLVDGADSFRGTIEYYEAFPIEPIVNPPGNLEIQVPVGDADRISPMSLLALMRRMLALPTEEKQLLISCHGTSSGLAMPLAPGGAARADAFFLHILFILAIDRIRVAKINLMPKAQQVGEWKRLFRDSKYLDGQSMFPPAPAQAEFPLTAEDSPVLPGQSAEFHQRLFDWFFNRSGGGRDIPFPQTDDVQKITPPKVSSVATTTFEIDFKGSKHPAKLKPTMKAAEVQPLLEAIPTIGKKNISVSDGPGGTWICTFINALGAKPQPPFSKTGGADVVQKNRRTEAEFGVQAITTTPAQLTELVTLRNQIFGRFDRLEFRSCNTGKRQPGESPKDPPLSLITMKHFFGCGKLCAPDVVSFEITLRAQFDPAIGEQYDNMIDVATRNALRADEQGRHPHRPRRLDRADGTLRRLLPIPRDQLPKTRLFDTNTSRRGNEVFIRLWVTDVLPHRFFGWMRAVTPEDVVQFVRDRIDPHITRWTNHHLVPMAGLWLMDDFNLLMPGGPATLDTGPSNGDPLGGFPEPTSPAFALARDPEYSPHLICV